MVQAWILLTLQSEDATAQGVHNTQQGHLIRHVEEVLLLGLAGDRFDLIHKRLDLIQTLILTIVITQDLYGGMKTITNMDQMW